jgi:uncharacterized protein (DUF924 family)
LEQPKEILQFWFGTRQAGEPVNEERSRFWFKGDSSTDADIKAKFAGLVQRAREGKLKEWEDSPEGCLALILLHDQFSRHIYRGSPEAFTHDTQALRLCLRGIDRGWDRQFDIPERVFFYFPMVHAEDLQVQKKGLEFFIRLAQDVSEVHWDFIDEVLNHAIEHHEVIERFGRFPKRNTILGRESTTDEIAYLSEPQ